MITNRTRWMALSAALLMAIPFVASSQSEVPAAINYQGRLTDTLGDPLPNGYYEIEFRIWDDSVATNAGDLVWARSFPLHVVTNGVFNVLLTDAGGQVTTPTTTTTSLLDAFGGPDRYLGLTITVSNGVSVSDSEISPRQQLASAPFAVQAQTANGVVAGGVTGAMLQSGSVTTPTLADGAVTTAKIGSSQVTTAKLAANAVATQNIQDGAVTSAKININGDINLNHYGLYLGTGGTANGLLATNAFGGATTGGGGPALFGQTGGVLGTTGGGQKAALSWDKTGSVSLWGSPINLAVPPSDGNTVTYVANADGLFTFYIYATRWAVQIWKGGTTPVFTGTGGADSGTHKGWAVINAVGQSLVFGKSFTWPLQPGDKISYYQFSSYDTTSVNSKAYFTPFGLGAPSSSISKQ